MALAIVASCTNSDAMTARLHRVDGQRLAGMWDATFTLEVGLVAPDSSHPEVHGRLALLPNRWLDASYPGVDVLSNYGAYDIDLGPLGIEPRAHGETPTVVAGWTSGDSVQMWLTSGTPSLSVTLRGRLTGDSISGQWEYAVARASGGTGRFLLRRVGR